MITFGRRFAAARRRAAAVGLGVWAALTAAQAGELAGAALGLPAQAAPPSAQVALGRKLFSDRRLSVNGTLSCAMCHVPAQAFTVNELRTSVGMEGVSLRRNAPSLLNVGFVRQLFVDGRTPSLEAQALLPLVHPDEMANANLAAAMARIDALRDYRTPLRAAFGAPRATPERVGAALAAYQRTLVAAGSRFDRWYFGRDAEALSALEQRGFALFRQLGCARCHTIGVNDALFTDEAFHNVGVQARSEAQRERAVDVTLVPGLVTQVTPQTLRRIGVDDAADLGRFEVTQSPQDQRAFRTPSLRNVALTAPYMHDGSFDTLEQVIDHYAQGGTPSDPWQDPAIAPLHLDAADRRALIGFLQALTSPAAAALAQEEASAPGPAAHRRSRVR
jgi:cytochrome c peroxidase